eukprot:1160727-Pelagomonas_calceolata.AAC.6
MAPPKRRKGLAWAELGANRENFQGLCSIFCSFVAVNIKGLGVHPQRQPLVRVNPAIGSGACTIRAGVFLATGSCINWFWFSISSHPSTF